MKFTFGHDESGDTGGGDGRDHGVPLLLDRYLPVPPAVDLGGGEHVTSTAHVAKSTLAGAVSTAAADTWDTGHGTTCAPGLGAGLVTCNHTTTRRNEYAVLGKQKNHSKCKIIV